MAQKIEDRGWPRLFIDPGNSNHEQNEDMREKLQRRRVSSTNFLQMQYNICVGYLGERGEGGLKLKDRP